MTSPVKQWRNQKRIRSLLGKEGKIIAWTMIFVPPANFSSYAPYPVVLVELTDGEKITTQLVDYDETKLQTGQSVKLVLRRIMDPTDEGIIPYGIKAKPM